MPCIPRVHVIPQMAFVRPGACCPPRLVSRDGSPPWSLVRGLPGFLSPRDPEALSPRVHKTRLSVKPRKCSRVRRSSRLPGGLREREGESPEELCSPCPPPTAAHPPEAEISGDHARFCLCPACCAGRSHRPFAGYTQVAALILVCTQQVLKNETALCSDGFSS